MTRHFFIICLALGLAAEASGQQLLSALDAGNGSEKEFVTNAFKSTRIINTHSAELLTKRTLDVRILHRFGNLNSGVNNLYGLDQANMRLGFDYGISNRFMVGVGRSNVNKELDGFVKYRLLWQATGRRASPISVILVAGTTLNTAPQTDTAVANYFSSRAACYYQLVLARKFSDGLTLQFTPGVVHYNLVERAADPNDIYSIGFGGRLKITRRTTINWDYQYVLPGYLPSGYYHYVGLGVDIETGGHVFQLHVTNSIGMNERAFITRTSGNPSKMEVRLGFNLSRVFTIGK